MAKKTTVNGIDYSILVDYTDGTLLKRSHSGEVFLHLPKLDEMIKLEVNDEKELRIVTASKSRIFLGGGIELGKKVGIDRQNCRERQTLENTIYVKRNCRTIILVTDRDYILQSICIPQFG